MIALQQQLALQISQGTALQAAQGAALIGMIPLIPQYEQGGPVLKNTLAMVHGGEHVVPVP
jgi:hypothetical protein